MSSWFGDLATKLQEVSDTVTEKAKNAIPLDQQAMMEKLTLTTPELFAERKKFDEEEKRKEHIKDCLAGMLPWETLDPERDILVEECKEAILKLSEDPATFQGPYKMPSMTVNLENDDSGEEKEEGEDDEDDIEAKEDKEKPSEESLDKLATLEPLPKLLGEFDLDAHVGLIERLLSEDPTLVRMQSKLSGGGEREHYFWKNYFFHCAFARYEAGLTIDEIWNDEDPSTRKTKQDADAAAAAAAAAALKVAEENTETVNPAVEEETITFDQEAAKGDALNSAKEEALVDTPVESGKEPSMAPETQEVDEPVAATSREGSPEASANTDFEQVGSDTIPDDEDFGDEGFDVEMDELEAEIARELEG